MFQQVVRSDEVGEGYGNCDKKNKPIKLYNLPSPFPPNFSLVLKLPV